MKPRTLLLCALVYVLASATISVVAEFVTLVMFSGVTGPFGYIAWIVIDSPAHFLGVGDDLKVSSTVSGLFWGLPVAVGFAAVLRRRP